MPTRIDPYSLSAVPIEQFFDDTSLGNATAFVWERQDKFYLVTNWHVVTCRNNESGASLASHGGEPNKLRALFRPKQNLIDTVPIDIALRDAEGRPLWLFHPVHEREIDVVAIPLPPPNDAWHPHPINKLSRADLSIQIGMDVFVLGYPFGSPPPSLPVWKRGSLASEPELVRLGDKYYLVDTASRPGMSGGPVFLRSYGVHLTESGPSITTDPATKFLGVYSGRLKTRDSEDAQLGRVWPQSYLLEIIDAQTRDTGAWD